MQKIFRMLFISLIVVSYLWSLTISDKAESASNATYSFGVYTVEAFTTVGTTTWTAPAGLSKIDVMVVAGGGSGNGGAGGLCFQELRSVTAGNSYTVTVGAVGNPGGNSVFDTITSNGGGAGVACYHNQGCPGGSGGGGGYFGYGVSGGSATQGASGGATGYGFAGGAGYYSNSGGSGYGQGGGAGGAGQSWPTRAVANGKNMSTYFGTNYGNSGIFAMGWGTGSTALPVVVSSGNGGQSGIVLIRYILADVTTQSCTSVTKDSVVANGTIGSTSYTVGNPTQRGFCYIKSTPSQGYTPTIANSVVSENGSFGAGAYSLPIAGLEQGVQYRVRAFVVNNTGVNYGATITTVNVSTLQTQAMTTQAVTNVTTYGATANGTIVTLSGGNATRRGFVFKKVLWDRGSGLYPVDYSEPDILNESVYEDGSFGTGAFSLPLHLENYQKYYVRAFSQNDTGIGYGSVVEVQTPNTGRTVVSLSSGSWLCPSGVNTLYETMVVAGGGTGNGGAGGLSFQTNRTVIPGNSYLVTVGVAGNPGGNSVFDTITSNGGGAGSACTNNSGCPGGSGGGGGCFGSGVSGGSSTQGNTGGATGYGFAGGAGYVQGGGCQGAGQGGGAGGAGVSTPGAPVNNGKNMSTYFGTNYGNSGIFAMGWKTGLPVTANSGNGAQAGIVLLSYMNRATVLTTQACTDVTTSSFRANGSRAVDYGGKASVRGFVYMTGSSGDPTIANSVISENGSFYEDSGSYSMSLLGLAQDRYRVRTFQTNDYGTFYGATVQVSLFVPTVLTSPPGAITTSSIVANGNMTAIGDTTPTRRGFCYMLGTTGDPTTDNLTVSDNGTFGVGVFSKTISGLSTATNYRVRAYAVNPTGTGYGDTITVMTSCSPPTNVAATDGTYPEKVRITWTGSTGATGYKIYDNVTLLATLGDVTTYDDFLAGSPTITPGVASASDGASLNYVTLSVSGESASPGASRVYKVRAVNPSGDSLDSSTNSGYRGITTLNYQWQRSWGDSDDNFTPISGGIADPYNDTEAPADGSGRYYYCVISMAGANIVTAFTTVGSTTWTAPVGVTEINLLVVAGGGGGGEPTNHPHGYGGGGGAGGLISQLNREVIAGNSYPVTVGNKGLYVSMSSGTNGGNSVFDNITAFGGGGGGEGGINGAAGGSGGGGGGHGETYSGVGGVSTQTSNGGATGYGFKGGDGYYGIGNNSGGGGGAGLSGYYAMDVDHPGCGGDGKDYSSIFGTAYGYPGGWFAGGGGGMANVDYPKIGQGGLGGGGRGFSPEHSVSGTPGIDGTGGGGGDGYNGGSGIVLLRYFEEEVVSPQNTTHDRGWKMRVPAVVTSFSLVEAVTAYASGNVVDGGGGTVSDRGVCYSTSPSPSLLSAHIHNGNGLGSFSSQMIGLSPGTVYYVRAFAINEVGTGYGNEVSLLTKPAPVTGMSASENNTSYVTVTWTNSTGATSYHVWRGATDLGSQTSPYNDDGAEIPLFPLITAGSVVASDGTNPKVELSLSGASIANGTTYIYKVVAHNATGSSTGDSTDAGYRLSGTLSYQWQRSLGDSSDNYTDLDLATTSTWSDDSAPPDGTGRYYTCILTSVGASNSPVSAVADRGYRFLVPRVTTVSSNSVSSDGSTYTAIANGARISDEGGEATVRGFAYMAGIEGDPTIVDNSFVLEYGSFYEDSGAYSLTITGLSISTKYYRVRAFQTNQYGTGYGETVQLTFQDVPNASTQDVSSIDIYTAVGNGEITKIGFSNVSRRGFCYMIGSTGDPTIANSVVYEDGSFGVGSYSKHIAGLLDETEYRIRSYAVNSVGVGYGNTVSFMTLNDPSFIYGLEGWSYRKEIVIAHSTDSSIGPLRYYQMKLRVGEGSTIPTGGIACMSFVASDFRDLRFTTSNGHKLCDYWIESIEGTTPNQVATVWIEVPLIAAHPTDTTIYMYYGNPNAEAVSNGDNTFLFFDDFSTTWNSPAKWSGNTMDSSSSNGIMTLMGGSHPHFLKSLTSFSGDVAFRGRLNISNGDYSYAGLTDNSTTNANGVFVQHDSVNVIPPLGVVDPSHSGWVSSYLSLNRTLGSADAGFGEYHIYDLARMDSGNPDVSSAWMDNGLVGSRSDFVPLVDLSAFLKTNLNILSDWVLIRKLVTTPPTWGSFRDSISVVTTQSVTDVNKYSATAHGSVISEGSQAITERGFYYCLFSDGLPSDNLTNSPSSKKVVSVTPGVLGAFEADMVCDEDGTKYNVRSYVLNSVGISYGGVVNFTTLTPSSVTTQSVTDIAKVPQGGYYTRLATATAHGTVVSEGSETVIERGFCYLAAGEVSEDPLSPFPMILDNALISPIGSDVLGVFSVSMTDLTAGTAYRLRAYVRSVDIYGVLGVYYGDQVLFSTLPNLLPTITTDNVTDITDTTCVASGTVRMEGDGPILDRGFDVQYSGNVSVAGSLGSFSQSIENLPFFNNIQIRAYASNEFGTSYGNYISFRTLGAPPSVTLLSVVNQCIDETCTVNTSVLMTGIVTSEGGGSVQERGFGIFTNDYIYNHSPIRTCVADNSSGVMSEFSGIISGLAILNDYYARAYVITEYGTVWGNVIGFNTAGRAPTVSIPTITDITERTAILHGRVTNKGDGLEFDNGVITERGFTINNRTIPVAFSPGEELEEFTLLVEGLAMNTPYIVRSYAINQYGTNWDGMYWDSQDYSWENQRRGGGSFCPFYGYAGFLTLGSLPTMTTQTITNFPNPITQTTATIRGSVLFEGSKDTEEELNDPRPKEGGIFQITDYKRGITERGFLLKAWASPTLLGCSPGTRGWVPYDRKIIISGASGDMSSDLVNLLPNTTYYYRTYAINSVHYYCCQNCSYPCDFGEHWVGYGEVKSFTTDSSPTVSTQSVVNWQSRSTTTVMGNVTSDGGHGTPFIDGDGITERGFVYCLITHGIPNVTDGKKVVAGTTGVFTDNLTGLSEGSKYNVRAYATNAVGTSYGSMLNFNTIIVIRTPAELQAVNNNSSGHYEVDNDIDMTGYDFVPLGSPNGGLRPIVVHSDTVFDKANSTEENIQEPAINNLLNESSNTEEDLPIIPSTELQSVSFIPEITSSKILEEDPIEEASIIVDDTFEEESSFKQSSSPRDVGEESSSVISSEVTSLTNSFPQDLSSSLSSGCAWLVAQQKSDGSFVYNSNDSAYVAADTGFAVTALEHYAEQLGTTPLSSTYIYHENVRNGLNYLFSAATKEGSWVYWNSPSSTNAYQTGPCLMAIARSGASTSIVSGGALNGMTYKQVSQSAVDWLASAQSISGDSNGSWGYYKGDGLGDESATGWVTIGLGYAQNSMSCVIPAEVLTRLSAWNTIIQSISPGTTLGGASYRSGFGYWYNAYKNGHLLYQQKLAGDAISTSRVQNGLTFLNTHWSDATNGVNSSNDYGWRGNPPSIFPSYIAMMTLTKGFTEMGIETIGSYNWYNDFSGVILANQYSDGHWLGGGHGENSLRSTCWALMSLLRAYSSPSVISSISPSEGYQGLSYSVMVTGTKITGATSFSFGEGVTVTSFDLYHYDVDADQSIYRVNISINANASVGTRNVSVTNPEGSATRGNGFSVLSRYLRPVITSIAPSSGYLNQNITVVITGSNFLSVNPSATRVLFKGYASNGFPYPQGESQGKDASVTVDNDTQITATLRLNNLNESWSCSRVSVNVIVQDSSRIPTGYPNAYTDYDYTISNMSIFNILCSPVPVITSISPSGGLRGQTVPVTITGSGFVDVSTGLPSGAINISGSGLTATDVIAVTSTTMTANIVIDENAALGAYNVFVTASGGTSVAKAFTVMTSTITSISPSSGWRGQTTPVIISGTNLLGTTLIDFGSGIIVTPSTITASQITATMVIAEDAALGVRGVSITTPNGVATKMFTVMAPTVTSISPSSGLKGQSGSVTIVGTNFINVSSVSLGSGITVSNINVVNTTTITADISIGLDAFTGAHDVSVTTAGSPATKIGGFTVMALLPTITSIDPTSSLAGESFPAVITGTNFMESGISVSYGGQITVTDIVVVNSTMITANISVAIDASPGLRNVIVTTSEGSASLAGFSIIQIIVTGDNLYFSGKFDGMGHTISNLTVDGIELRENHSIGGGEAALFGNITDGAIIEDVVLTNVNISGGAGAAGLVAWSWGKSGNITISCSSVGGNISSEYYAGGLIGYVEQDDVGFSTTIEECYSTATVTGAGETETGKLGGLIGYSRANHGAIIIQNCYSSGSIIDGTTSKNGHMMGGLIGWIEAFGEEGSTVINNCYSSSIVPAGKSDSGGFFGRLNSELMSTVTFISCYWDTEKSGQSEKGVIHDAIGIIAPDYDTYGWVYDEDISTSNSWVIYDNTTVTLAAPITLKHGKIKNGSETLKSVDGSITYIKNVDYLIDNVNGIITPIAYDLQGNVHMTRDTKYHISYYEVKIGVIEGSPTGKTISQMRSKSTFVGWDFVNIWGISPSVNDGRPHLAWLPPATSFPSVVTKTATNIDCVGSSEGLGKATLNGSIVNSTSNSQVRFVYRDADHAEYQWGSPNENISSDCDFSAVVDMVLGQTYYYRAIGIVDGLTYQGEEVIFSSSSSNYWAYTDLPVQKGDGGFTLHGFLGPNTGTVAPFPMAECNFQWGLSTDNWTLTDVRTDPSSWNSGAETTHFSFDISSSLIDITKTYKCRSVVQVPGSCPVYGEIKYFSFSGVSVVTENVTNLNFTGATLNGTVRSSNTEFIVFFYYGKTAFYDRATDNKTLLHDGSFFGDVTDLDPDTTYHYRALVQTENDTGHMQLYWGEDKTFTTTSSLPGYSVFTVGSSDVSSTAATLYGSAVEMNSPTQCFFQYVSSSSVDWGGALDTSMTNMSSPGSFSSTASLSVGIKYKFRSVMKTTSGGRTYGNTEYFICPGSYTDKNYMPINVKWIYNIYPEASMSNNWTVISSLTPQGCVNKDWRSPNDTNYLYATADGKVSRFSFSDYLAGTVIDKVVVTVRARRVSGNDNLSLFLSSSDNITESGNSNLFVGTTIIPDYQNLETTFLLNPVTRLSWTREDVTNMTWGIRKVGSESNVYVSQMYVTIYPAKINDQTTLTNSTNWVSMNMDSLIASGYLSSGLDSDFYYDKSLSYIPGNVRSYFSIPSLSAGQEASYRLKLATSPPYDRFNLVGTTSFLDNASYEPGLSNLEISWRGKVDTTIPGYIVRKANSYELIVNSNNSVQGKIWIVGVNDPLVVTDNISLSKGYHLYEMKRMSYPNMDSILSLYRDGVLRDSVSFSPGLIVDNGNSVEIGGSGTVGYSDLMTMFINSFPVMNPLPGAKITGSTIGDGYGRSGNIVVNKLFEMWTEGIVSGSPNDPWIGPGGDIVDDEGGNLSDVVVTPGFIPNLFGGTDVTGGDIPQSDPNSPVRSLPMHNEVIVPAAKALGVTTQWLWMMIMVTLSICVALLVFTWINSPWFAIMALCLCLFVFSFTGVLPAWIGLVTAIVGLASLFFGARSGF